MQTLKNVWARYWGTRWFVKWPIAVLVGLVVLVAVVPPAEEEADAEGGGTAADTTSMPAAVAATETATGAAPATSTPTATPTATPTEPPTPSRPVIEDGTWMVGAEVEPGRYRSSGGSSCYWERLSGLSGGLGDLIANDLPSGEAVVDILPSDLAFKSQRCGTWYGDEAEVPITLSPDASFGDGTWIVGVDISPGTWRGEGGASCYWERLSDFTGQLAGLLANDLPAGPPLVQVAPTDAGFSTSGCGNWTLVQ